MKKFQIKCIIFPIVGDNIIDKVRQNYYINKKRVQIRYDIMGKLSSNPREVKEVFLFPQN